MSNARKRLIKTAVFTCGPEKKDFCWFPLDAVNKIILHPDLLM